jgi:hypothetical protein
MLNRAISYASLPRGRLRQNTVQRQPGCAGSEKGIWRFYRKWLSRSDRSVVNRTHNIRVPRCPRKNCTARLAVRTTHRLTATRRMEFLSWKWNVPARSVLLIFVLRAGTCAGVWRLQKGCRQCPINENVSMIPARSRSPSSGQWQDRTLSPDDQEPVHSSFDTSKSLATTA